MFGPTFSSSVAFGEPDSQSQTPMGSSSLVPRNSRPSANSNASSSNRIPLGTSVLFGTNPRPSSATRQVAATLYASKATEVPVEREPEDIMDHDAAQSDHSDNESESDFSEDKILTTARIDPILAGVPGLAADSAAAAANAQSCI